MEKTKNLENQKRFVEAKKNAGLKRVVLWARPEDVDALKTIARQPHAIAKLAKKVERELRPVIEQKIAGQLEAKTRRAMLTQKRAAAQRHPASSNSPPALIRFAFRPPAAVRDKIKAAGWLYDPVAAVWHLPEDPKQWPTVQGLLDELAPYGVTPLANPQDQP